MQIELVYATPEHQALLELELAAGASVADALASPTARALLADVDVSAVGVWGHSVTGSHLLRDGDRIEIYRPLKLDPREARRRCAAAGVTMAVGTDAG